MKKNNDITLKISHLCKKYDAITASDDLSFCARRGEIIALLGPNGAGKSTLMNMISGYLAPSSGSIEVLGKNIAEAALFAKENIGFLPEGSPLYPDISVKMFLQYMAELRGAAKERVNEVIEIANISNIVNQKIETLSKGYQRRVGFAQSILSNPPLLLLDEPTDGLDPNQKDYIRKLIVSMAKDKTIIISTHLLEEAETVCNRIILLDKGKIKADGSLKDILKEAKAANLEEAFRNLTAHKGE
ncbi:MAG: ABC transporter ATP-binding protein [Alphaproteobacteria bacterium]|nr:ABC transporter ATP-binding protein [Alphaproteobacteria bacterium]MDY4690089.1 ABC transporter ATP-binding protein [Alphaproteobacteria bacterium]